MTSVYCFFLWTLLICLVFASEYRFPSDFIMGAATSAVQVEGAANDDGKGENTWDYSFRMNIVRMPDNSSTEIAANSYYLWERDIEIAQELGLDVYRFSISWSRILPNGLTDKVNDKGVLYYNKLIDGLLAAGIQPVVTMYHLDLPHNLDIQGGWENPSMIDWFFDYAKLLLSCYADRVKYWLTINEAYVICDYLSNSISFPYPCTKNILLAHAKVYRYYHKHFSSMKGLVSFPNVIIWIQQTDNTTSEEMKIIELTRQFYIGRYFYPIFSEEGGWPPMIENLVNDMSMAQGCNSSWLPSFTQAEKDLVRGSVDFIGLNYYAAKSLILTSPANPETNELFKSVGINFSYKYDIPGIYKTPCISRDIHPEGLRNAVIWLRNQYGNWNFMITENGYPDCNRTLYDSTKITVMGEYLQQVLKLIYEDGVNMIGYIYFSMIDAFEFNYGYIARYGLYDVDIEDPNRARTPRDSAHYYTCITQKRTLQACDRIRSDAHNN